MLSHHRRILILLALCSLFLAGCGGTPSNVKKHAGYLADTSVKGKAHNARVRFLVIHYTGSNDSGSLRTLSGPQVSAHYLVPSKPRVHDGMPIVRQMVPEYRRAWHAGISSWRNRNNLNDSSIGIEIVNRGPIGGGRWQGYSNQQMQAVAALARDIVRRYNIKPTNVVGHSDISPGRKTDPGPLFPWYRLHKAGVGAWPNRATVNRYRQQFTRRRPSTKAIQTQLKRYGYDVNLSGWMDQKTKKALYAFQLHFRPRSTSGQPDIDTLARLWALNAKYH